MERDLLQVFYNSGTFDLPEDRGPDGGPSNRDIAQGNVEDPIGIIGPESVTEAFEAGRKSGGAALDADIEYFGALFNTVVGDQEAAETNVRRARIKEAQAAIPVSTMESFEEFYNEPTIEGFFMQIGKGTGELFPSAVTSIASGGIGGLTAVIGKAGLSKVGKAVANRVVKDSLQKTAEGTADAVEKELAQSAWNMFKFGAYTGAGGAEYVPMAGGNLSEALEAGQDLNQDTALRAGAVAIPQAVLGVGAEAAMLKLIGNVAKKRAVKEGSLFGRLAKDIGGTGLKGGLMEGATEFAQEGIGVLNRMDYDDTYTAQDAKMRLAQSAFAGFFGGGAAASAGGTVGSIFSQANQLIDKGRQAEVDQQVNEEQFGDLSGETTTEEAQSDLAGQVEAMLDQTSSKQAVWAAGTTPVFGAKENTITPVQIEGSDKPAYAAYIPGRGTIVSVSEQIVADVIASEGSDSILQAALGYSNVKTDDGNLAVVVTDKQGRVVSEELTTEENRAAAEEAARKLMPEGGSFKTISAEQALEERKKRVEQERGPVVRPMDDEDSKQVDKEMGYNRKVSAFDEGAGEFESETSRLREYAPRNTEREYENTDSTRKAFKKAFGEEMDIDWNNSFYNGMSESLMKAAIAAKKANPTALVTITTNNNFKYDLNLETTPETETFSIGAQEQKLPIGEFIAQSVRDADRVAKNDDFNNKDKPEAKVTVVAPDGKETIAILADLVNAGRRVVAKREGINFTEVTDQQAYSALAGEMLADPDNRYDIQVEGESIFGDLSSDARIKANRVRVGGTKKKPKRLGPLLKRPIRTAPPRRQPKQGPAPRFSPASRPDRDSRRFAPEDVTTTEAEGATQTSTVNVFFGSGENASLSNLASRPFTYEGRDYLTVEHAYQTLKGGSFDQKTYDAYNRLPDAAGKKITGPRAITKDNANITLMEALMRASFDQNPDAAKALVDTGDARITHDQDRGVWKKEFPRILSEIRATYRNRADENANQLTEEETAKLEKARADFKNEVENNELLEDGDIREVDFNDEYFARMPTALLEEAVRRNRRKAPYQKVVIEQDGDGLYTIQDTDKDLDSLDPIAGLTPEEQQIEDARNELFDLPLSQLNLEAGRVEKRRSYSEAKPKSKGGRNPMNATYPAGSIGRLASQVASGLVKKLRLQKPVSILGIKELAAMSEGKFNEMFTSVTTDKDGNRIETFDPRVAAAVREQMNALLDNNTALGRYMGFNDAHVILVDNRSGNQLQTALTTAHELGHALFQEEMLGALNNTALYRRLIKEFETARAAKDAPAAYQDPNNELAFEEWYADQVAIYAKNIYWKETLPAKNLAASHFKKVAGKLVDMYRTLSREMKRRFGKDAKNQQFTAYMDSLAENKRRYWTAAKNKVGTKEATFQQKALVRAIEDAMPKSKFEKAAESLGRLLNEILSNPTVRKATQLVRTEDGVLRTISTKIADMVYIPAQSEGKGSDLGFVKSKQAARKRYINGLKKILGSDWTTPEVQETLKAARNAKIPTDQLPDDARKVREFLESFYDNYIATTPGNVILKRDNYFPTALDLQKIVDDPERFVGIILRNDPSIPASTIRDTVHRLVKLQKKVLDDDEINVDATDPSAVAEAARVFTNSLNPADLAEFSLPPDQALQEYIREQTTRNEFLRATRAPDGTDLLAEEMEKLSEVDREEVVAMLERHLGYSRKPIGPKLRAANSWGQLFQWVTLLPLATVSSITELGGAVLNGKDFDAFGMAWKAMKQTIQNPIEAKELGEDLGVTSERTMENMMMTDADHEYMDPKAREIGDKFFQVIGLDWFTRFTREFASNMGVQFMLRHAVNESGNPRSERYLTDLGVSAADVKAWEADGRSFDSDAGRRVRDGLTRFVESSMLRPNSAERPSWANDPRFALIWQLKSFLYSFSKTIGGGILREAKARARETNTTGLEKLGGVGMTLALAGVAFMPLAMISLELRELAKYLIAGVLPGVDQAGGKYFRSDRMDWGQYWSEIFDRSGFNGPMSIATSMMNADRWGSTPLAPLLGPTYDLAESAVLDGWEVIPDRILPGYSIVY